MKTCSLRYTSQKDCERSERADGTNQRLERTKLEEPEKFRIILVVLVVLVKLVILVVLEKCHFQLKNTSLRYTSQPLSRIASKRLRRHIQ